MPPCSPSTSLVRWSMRTIQISNYGNIENLIARRKQLATLKEISNGNRSPLTTERLAGTATGVAFLIVSVISGFLVAQSGMYWVLLPAMATTIAAIIYLWTIPIPEAEIVRSEGKLDIRGTLAIISGVTGLWALILFTTFNNFLGGVFMALTDAYGLSRRCRGVGAALGISEYRVYYRRIGHR
jgi:hypothetical protein